MKDKNGKELLYRKGVSALILNSKDEILLVNLQSFNKQYYAIPGGGIDIGESAIDAVYRELKEELNIDKEDLIKIGKSKKPIRLLFKTKKLKRDGIEYDGMERLFFGFRFIGDNSKIKCQEEEVREYKWVAFNNLDRYLLFDNQLDETIKKLKEIFKRDYKR